MATNPPVEAKVKAATTATLLVSLVLAVLNDVRDDASLLAPLPGWLQAIVIALVPPAVTFLSGWQARHTSRISQL
ncbi:holin [Streptomyces hygroscopicus]|uniref:holin n=1 Tax=Streptomyces hygroscopicus TaxID=1912 RepID=UPI0036B3BA63